MSHLFLSPEFNDCQLVVNLFPSVTPYTTLCNFFLSKSQTLYHRHFLRYKSFYFAKHDHNDYDFKKNQIKFTRFILFFSFIFISWRLITVQYCSGFCHTLTWISHGFTCVPHPNPPSHLPPIPSLWVIPVHHPGALVSCIHRGLAICFTLDSILVSMLFSQNIPPSPSPTESKSLFWTSVYLFLFCI